MNMLPTMSGQEAFSLGGRKAYAECKRRVYAHWHWLQTNYAEFRAYTIESISPTLAYRETRRVRGEYVLTQNDLIAGISKQTHKDVIAISDHSMDSHGGGGPSGELKDVYGVPYRCLLPLNTVNVLIAGRAASFSAIAASSCRLSRTMMQLGEAAGVAAHLAVLENKPLRQVPADAIRALMQTKIDGNPHAAPTSRKLVLADESRGALHYLDTAAPEQTFSVAVPKPVWDLKPCGENRYRTVGQNGFTVVDLLQRKVVDRFIHPALGGISAVCDLPDGGFLASVNVGNKSIHVLRFSGERKLCGKTVFDGIFNGRAMERLPNGELLITHDGGFVLGRIPESGETGIVVRKFAQPPRKMKNHFYAQPKTLTNGHVLVCNWAGHGANDSRNAWQVIEFDEQGRVVWFLHDPVRFGSISGVSVVR